MRTKTTSVPFTGPPSAVRFVVLELARQEHGNQNFEDSALHVNNGDKTKHRM